MFKVLSNLLSNKNKNIVFYQMNKYYRKLNFKFSGLVFDKTGGNLRKLEIPNG